MQVGNESLNLSNCLILPRLKRPNHHAQANKVGTITYQHLELEARVEIPALAVFGEFV